MAQLLATASDTLNQQAANTENLEKRQQAAEVLQQLQAHELALLKAFPLALQHCFSQNAASKAAPPPKSADLSFGELSLVDEKEHDAQIELVRAQQQATHATEAVLSELNTLVSSAQGLHHVQAESNPLRPASYICALQKVLDNTDVKASVRKNWMQLMLPALGPALMGVYQYSVHYLRQQGVAPAGYSVNSSRYGTPSSQPDSGYSGMGWQQSSSAYLEAQAQEAALTASILHQLLQGGTDPYSGMAPIAPVWHPEGAYGGMVPTAALDPTAQADAVVAQMMSQIIQDTRLLPAIQQALRELHPVIQQLARQDPEFFNNSAHPARRLLDQITERGIAFKSADTARFNQFTHLLRQAVQYLVQQNTPQAATFEQVIQALQKAWQNLEQREQQEQQQHQTQTRAAAQVSQHQRLTSQIADNIRKLTNTGHVPTEVMQFATGPWARVIAQVQLENIDANDDDPHGYLSLVPLLFWSIRPQMDANERQEIAEAVPGMLDSFQKGLRHIGQPEAEISHFIALLHHLHHTTLGAIEVASPPPAPTRVVDSPASINVSSPDIDIELEPDSQEDHTATTTATSVAVAPPPFQQAFPIGTWIELRGNRQTMRTQLTWASPQGTLFLFTAPDGSTQSMTQRTRDRLLNEGALRILTSE